MPPEDFGKTLSQKEKDLIRQWVLSGAEYADHWSFVPQPRTGLSPRSIPLIISLARTLKRRAMILPRRQTRQPWPRRASLILNGLPPEPEELDAFLKDNRPDAYEHYLERLFAKVIMGSMLPGPGWMRYGMGILMVCTLITAGGFIRTVIGWFVP